MSAIETLVEMGFLRDKAETALNLTGNQGVEAAMEWLLAHSGMDEAEAAIGAIATRSPLAECSAGSSGMVQDPESTFKGLDVSTDDEPAMSIDGDPEISTDDGPAMATEGEPAMATDDEPRSIVCEVCKRKFRSEAEANVHAIKTGHAMFAHSLEEIKPLTEEERKEKLKKVESLIKQRRAEKEEMQKKEELEREKSRRKTGQELTTVRQRLEEAEMKRLAEIKRKEKIDAQMARQRVLADIERDKQARREKFGGSVQPSASVNKSVPDENIQEIPKKNYDQCRLQIRLTNGDTIVQAFKPAEVLAAVRLYVEINRTDGTGPFTLMTNFPKKIFTEEDMQKPLSALGLMPSAVLIVSKAY